jgi:hypothetical protein
LEKKDVIVFNIRDICEYFKYGCCTWTSINFTEPNIFLTTTQSRLSRISPTPSFVHRTINTRYDTHTKTLNFFGHCWWVSHRKLHWTRWGKTW